MCAGAKKQENYADRPHVLVVDDDTRICELVSRYLIEQEFVVLSAADTREADQLLARFEVDVLVLDVMMPGETGLAFTARLRESSDIPVLLLTALGEVNDRIGGLEAGADDYLSKPFEPRELVLRLNAILKRSRNEEAARPFHIGAWHYNPDDGILSRGDDVQKLTAMDVNLLNALASQAGEVMSRDALADACGLEAGERTIDVQVTRLRRKIEEDTKNPRYLLTVRGKGYVLRI